MSPDTAQDGREQPGPERSRGGGASGWRAFLRRHLVLVIVIGVLLALTITLYLVEVNTSVRVFYRFAD